MPQIPNSALGYAQGASSPNLEHAANDLKSSVRHGNTAERTALVNFVTVCQQLGIGAGVTAFAG
jgi:hypothetical protein